MVPRLVERGYPAEYAAALAAAGGSLGIIVPPSIMFIIYGAITSTSIGDLFLAGILPGLLMVIFMCIAISIESRIRGIGDERSAFSAPELVKSIWVSRFALGAPVIILGGIYSGVFTPTEAAAVAVFYVLIFDAFSKRDFSFKNLYGIFVRSGSVIAIIAPIIMFSSVFGEVLSIMRIPDAIANAFLDKTQGYTLTLLTVLFLIVAIGCFLEAIASLLILTPIIIPIAEPLGIDPVQLGVFFVCALTIGFITPPVGINLFVASAISQQPYIAIARRVLPLLLALVLATLCVGWIPWLTLWFR